MDINRNNYESFFLLYLDRELSSTDKHEVEKFLIENSDLQKEFALLQQTMLIHDDTIFEPKELLFREEEKRRILPFYWMRIAAAVALILTTGWFIITAISKNHSEPKGVDHQPAIASTQSKQDPVKTNKENIVTEKSLAIADKLTEKKNSGKTILLKKESPNKLKGNTKDNLVETNNADQKGTSADVSDESSLAIQKSSAALEIQQDNLNMSADSKQVPVVAGATASALVIVSTDPKSQLKKEDAGLKESDYQTDNSISMIALDERNKSITGFFKKLTKANPDNNKTTSTRKLHVSVFQFSY
ncbi:MAG TPA: hypothetical protein VK772_10295 [Puia sp.]|nr:hypothetical protein [Puia sp.]